MKGHLEHLLLPAHHGSITSSASVTSFLRAPAATCSGVPERLRLVAAEAPHAVAAALRKVDGNATPPRIGALRHILYTEEGFLKFDIDDGSRRRRHPQQWATSRLRVSRGFGGSGECTLWGRLAFVFPQMPFSPEVVAHWPSASCSPAPLREDLTAAAGPFSADRFQIRWRLRPHQRRRLVQGTSGRSLLPLFSPLLLLRYRLPSGKVVAFWSSRLRCLRCLVVVVVVVVHLAALALTVAPPLSSAPLGELVGGGGRWFADVGLGGGRLALPSRDGPFGALSRRAPSSWPRPPR